MLVTAATLLDQWLSQRLRPEAAAWLTQNVERIAAGASPAKFYPAFSAVPRHVGKADLNLSKDELQAARALAPGFAPHRWSLDQAARTRLVLALPAEDVAAWLHTLTTLWDEIGRAHV